MVCAKLLNNFSGMNFLFHALNISHGSLVKCLNWRTTSPYLGSPTSRNIMNQNMLYGSALEPSSNTSVVALSIILSSSAVKHKMIPTTSNVITDHSHYYNIIINIQSIITSLNINYALVLDVMTPHNIIARERFMHKLNV